MSDIKPCPFCGAGETQERAQHAGMTMRGPGKLISHEIRHWCEQMPGMLSRMSVVFAGRDRESAVAAWNRRHD